MWDKIGSLVQWIARHKIVSLLLIIVLFAGPLVLIDCLYSVGFSYPIYLTGFSQSDIISYYVGFLGAFGTLCLSGMALYQNYIFKVENDKAQKKIEELERIRLTPKFFFWLHDFSAHTLKFKLKNVGQGVAYNVNVSDLTAVSDSISMRYQSIPKIFNPGDVVEITIPSVNLPRNRTVTFGIKMEYEDVTDAIWRSIYSMQMEHRDQKPYYSTGKVMEETKQMTPAELG